MILTFNGTGHIFSKGPPRYWTAITASQTAKTVRYEDRKNRENRVKHRKNKECCSAIRDGKKGKFAGRVK